MAPTWPWSAALVYKSHACEASGPKGIPCWHMNARLHWRMGGGWRVARGDGELRLEVRRYPIPDLSIRMVCISGLNQKLHSFIIV